MRATRSALRAVPTAPFDEIAQAVAEVEKAHAAVLTVREALNIARQDEHARRARFDGGDPAITLDELAKCRELRESYERRHAAAEDVEQGARVTLAQQEAKRSKREYEARIAHAAAWRTRMPELLARFAALRAELFATVEGVADVIGDAALAHQEAEALENVVRPLVSLGAQGVRAPTLSDARELVRVFLARADEKAGRSLEDGWIDPLHKPLWNDTNRGSFNAATAAIEEMENSNA